MQSRSRADEAHACVATAPPTPGALTSIAAPNGARASIQARKSGSSGTRSPRNDSSNHDPASRARSSSRVIADTGPWPFVVRSSEASWTRTRAPSLVARMSVSVYTPPSLTACSKAAYVFSGATAEAPRCPPTRSPIPLARQSTFALQVLLEMPRPGRVDLDPASRLCVKEVQVPRFDSYRDLVADLEANALRRWDQRADRAGADVEVDQEVAAERLGQRDRRLQLAAAHLDVLGAGGREQTGTAGGPPPPGGGA